MEWLDAHAGGVQALATLVLVVLSGYYAWASRALVRETHATLQATARMTLQSRLDRVSEILIQSPELFVQLDDPDTTGEEMDARFHIANILLAALEEAHTQYVVDRSMSYEEWNAWVATIDSLLQRRYLQGYWRRVRGTYSAPFQQFVDARLNGG